MLPFDVVIAAVVIDVAVIVVVVVHLTSCKALGRESSISRVALQQQCSTLSRQCIPVVVVSKSSCLLHPLQCLIRGLHYSARKVGVPLKRRSIRGTDEM